MAVCSARWCVAHTPEIRRGWILPRSGNERRQQLHVLVADVVDLLDAELADAPATEERAARRPCPCPCPCRLSRPPPRPPRIPAVKVAHRSPPAKAHAPGRPCHRPLPRRRLRSLLGRLGRQAAPHAARSPSRSCGACARAPPRASSSSTRTIMWRMTMSNTRRRRSSSAVIVGRAVDDLRGRTRPRGDGQSRTRAGAGPSSRSFRWCRRSVRRWPATC